MAMLQDRLGRPGRLGIAGPLVLGVLSIGLGLGAASRLTYHEAFVAQGAREILATGNWWHPSIGGLPWLEKPPLPFWLVAVAGAVAGEIDERIARWPSAIAALGLIAGISLLAGRRYGARVGMLTGAIQATTAWTVLRGRLAEADILLACLITWTLLAFDQIRLHSTARHASPGPSCCPEAWRWAFFGLLGTTSLVKGTGFGAVLVLSVVLPVLFWDRGRDRVTSHRLRLPAGWLLVAILTLAWPLAMLARYGPRVAGLWLLHVSARVGAGTGHGPFAGESWWEYVFNVLAQALPWTPLAVLGAWDSMVRLMRDRSSRVRPASALVPAGAGGDRLLWLWAVAPLVLVSLASARNAHYAIHAMVPWSVWSALGMVRVADRLVVHRGWSPSGVGRLATGAFTALAVAWGLGFWLAGPWFDRRGAEWAFYQDASRQLPAAEPIVLLYDDWDREPYPTPFGPIPHDLAVRLYYLNRPASWHFAAADLTHQPAGTSAPAPSMAVIGRDRDLPELEALGRIEILARDKGVRWDRSYVVARLWPALPEASPVAVGDSSTASIRR